MGRIIASVNIQNAAVPHYSKKLDMLVDTGASYLTLPLAWKKDFGPFTDEQVIELQIATQQVVKGTVCGPARIQVGGFRVIYNEVLFLDMGSDEGGYEPLLGYIVLEQCGVAVDMVGHRLLPVRHMDLKTAQPESVN